MKKYYKPELNVIKIDNTISLTMPSDALDRLCQRFPCLRRCGGPGCGPGGGGGGPFNNDDGPFSDSPFG